MSRKAKWREFSKEQIEEIVSSSFSTREVARRLGYSPNGGGTMQSLKQMYQEYNIDTSHFTGQLWNKGLHNYDSFTTNSLKKNGKTLRQPLVDLRGQRCECCGLTEWLGQPINLEVHHINGDRSDNRLENLQLLCPNCHSYTPNFKNKGRKKKEVTDDEFVVALLGSTSIHQALKSLNLSGGGNYDRAWKLIDEYDIEHLKKKKKN